VSASDRRGAAIESEDELAFYARACHPLPGYRPDGTVIPLQVPSKAQLRQHRERFMPTDKRAHEQRRRHEAACDEVERLFHGIDPLRTTEGKTLRVLDLYAKGWHIGEIASEVGYSASTVGKKLEEAGLR